MEIYGSISFQSSVSTYGSVTFQSSVKLVMEIYGSVSEAGKFGLILFTRFSIYLIFPRKQKTHKRRRECICYVKLLQLVLFVICQFLDLGMYLKPQSIVCIMYICYVCRQRFYVSLSKCVPSFQSNYKRPGTKVGTKSAPREESGFHTNLVSLILSRISFLHQVLSFTEILKKCQSKQI